MKKFLLLLLGMSMLSLAGCASINPLFESKPQENTEVQADKKQPAGKEIQAKTENLSIPQLLKTQTAQTPKDSPAIRNYAGFTQNELAKAVEKVLYLMDPTDAKIVQQDDAVINYRYYSDKINDKFIFGYDTWVVSIKVQKNKSFDIALMIGIAQDFSTSAASSVQPKTPAEIHFKTNALDEAESALFFERLDYFLGKNPAWRSCENIQTWVQENNYKGMFQNTTVSNSLDLPFICGHNWYGIEDKSPDFLKKK